MPSIPTAPARRLMLPLALALATTAAFLVVPTPEAAARQGPGCGVRVIAHRGHHRGATENTLRAFRGAARRGADAIETDLRTTRDHRIVLMHDRTLGRTTRARGRVRLMTGRQVHAVRTNDGQRVPYVVDALRFLRHHKRMRAVFELKRMTRRSMVRLRRQLVRTRTLSRVTVASTRRPHLRLARQVMPHVRRVRITWTPVRPRVSRRFVEGVMLPLKRLSARRVIAYRRHGLAVGAMPADRPRAWRKIIAVGIRTVSTDNVPRFRRFCRRTGA